MNKIIDVNRQISAVIRWYLSTAKRYFSLMPGSTAIVIFLSVLGKITMMLAMLVPVKVILLLGSPKMPRYFPEAFQAIGRDELIVGLSVASVIFYFLNTMLSKLIRAYVAKCTQFLTNKTKKMELYNDQKKDAEKAFGGFMSSISGLLFLVLSLTLLYYIYPAMLVAVLGYLVLAGSIIVFLYGFSEKFRIKFEGLKTRANVFSAVSTAGFFFSFVFIVTDFIVPLNPPSLVYAVMGFILTRQALQGVSLSVSFISRQYENRSKVEALFFHGHLQVKRENREEITFWELLEPDRRKTWIVEVLHKLACPAADSVAVSWHGGGGEGTVMLLAEIQASEQADTENYLVLLFNKNSTKKAMNNARLFKACKKLSVLLDFVGATEVDGHQCHVFRWIDCEKVTQGRFNSARIALMKRLVSYEIPHALIEPYARTHPFIWQRLSNKMLLRLKIMADDQQLQTINHIEHNLESIKDILRDLPMSLVFSKIGNDALVYTFTGDVKLITWGGWGIEPVGYGWPSVVSDIPQYSNDLKEAKKNRKALEAVSDEMFQLSVAMADFERAYSKQDFVGAIDALTVVVGVLSVIRNDFAVTGNL